MTLIVLKNRKTINQSINQLRKFMKFFKLHLTITFVHRFSNINSFICQSLRLAERPDAKKDKAPLILC